LAEQLQLRQGTAEECALFVGAPGEPFFDTTNNRIGISDGVTQGGFEMAKLSEVQINSRTTVSDANYNVLPSDRMIAFVALTAGRDVFLPSSTTFPLGVRLLILDETGNCSSADPITVVVDSGDTINGSNITASIQAAFGFIDLETNQNGKWVIVGQDLVSQLLGLPTTLPANAGVLWLSGGIPEISQP
jgi:Major tropism determinant N-terminal domain